MSDDKTSPVRVTDKRGPKGYGAARLEEKSRVMAMWNRRASMGASPARTGNPGRSPGRSADSGPGWPER